MVITLFKEVGIDCCSSRKRFVSFNASFQRLKVNTESAASSFIAAQNHEGGERRRLLIDGPGRSERMPHFRDLPLQTSRRFPKRRAETLVQIALANARHGKIELAASSGKYVAKEFPFRRVDQRMRRQNIRKRWQPAARGQQDSGAHHSVSPIAQFVHDRADTLPSESGGGGKAIREMFLCGGKVQRLREMVRLLRPRSTGSNDNQLVPYHNLRGTCDLGHRDHGSPAGMHPDTDSCPLHGQRFTNLLSEDSISGRPPCICGNLFY
jgi:hypothetical protein